MLDRLHYDDGIVHHDADGQHQAEQRQVIETEKPRRPSLAKVPMMATGTATSGIRAARQLPRKTRTTRGDQDNGSRAASWPTSLIRLPDEGGGVVRI